MPYEINPLPARQCVESISMLINTFNPIIALFSRKEWERKRFVSIDRKAEIRCKRVIISRWWTSHEFVAAGHRIDDQRANEQEKMNVVYWPLKKCQIGISNYRVCPKHKSPRSPSRKWMFLVVVERGGVVSVISSRSLATNRLKQLVWSDT